MITKELLRFFSKIVILILLIHYIRHSKHMEEKMQLYCPLELELYEFDWYRKPELTVLDAIIEKYTEMVKFIADDVLALCKDSNYGRKNSFTVEQVLRGALYKELMDFDYEEMEFATYDSKTCRKFVKIEPGDDKYSNSVLQKYIAAIKPENLRKVMKFINEIAIAEGLEDLQKLRPDSTVVETDIQHPTNNKLIWDCIKTSYRLLTKIEYPEIADKIRNYTKQAKRHYYSINMKKGKKKRKPLFKKQLVILKKSINQVENTVSHLACLGDKVSENDSHIKQELSHLLVNMKKVYDISYRHEILNERVPNEDKIFSIYEDHTDIIVKGGKCTFGHKVFLATGTSNLILHCSIPDGNPSDTKHFKPILNDVVDSYSRVPRDVSSDGGFASLKNRDFAEEMGVQNIVFNKIVGSLKNKVSSKNMETRLRKWRSGIEAVISNLKRGFDLVRCTWKTRERFDAKVLWSVIAYNIRVMSRAILKRLKKQVA